MQIYSLFFGACSLSSRRISRTSGRSSKTARLASVLVLSLQTIEVFFYNGVPNRQRVFRKIYRTPLYPEDFGTSQTVIQSENDGGIKRVTIKGRL